MEQWGVRTTLDSRKRTLARASSGRSVVRDEPGRAAILLDSRPSLLCEADKKEEPEELYYFHATPIADRHTNNYRKATFRNFMRYIYLCEYIFVRAQVKCLRA